MTQQNPDKECMGTYDDLTDMLCSHVRAHDRNFVSVN